MALELFLVDSYRKSCPAKVAGVIEEHKVFLDQTIFYPGGGGQPSDRGVLYQAGEAYQVVDVKKADGQILHELDRPLTSLETPVELQLDWEWRYQNMRYHTLLHILSGYMFTQHKALATSSQIEEEYARLELTLPSEPAAGLTAEKIEEDINKILSVPRDVNIATISRDEAEKKAGIIKTTVSLLPPSLREIRTVEIEAVDVQACGGTHLNNTGEIGDFSITQMKKRGKNRLKIKVQWSGHINQL